MSKIAKADRDAMNALYAGQLQPKGFKVAADKEKDSDAGYTFDPDAFRDHEQFVKTVEDVLKEDQKAPSVDPNDVNFD